MNAAVQRFLNDVWSEMMTIYNKETIRINEFIGNRPLQAGIKDYLQVAWREGKIHIDVEEPLDWTDSSYEIEAGPYIAELTDELIRSELYPALCKRVEELFLSDKLGPRFFDYRFQIVLSFEMEDEDLTLCVHLVNEEKLNELRKSLQKFITSKIMSDLPVLPSVDDQFFFSHHLMNPDLLKQEENAVGPLIERLSDKLRSNRGRLDEWTGQYTSAMDDWIQNVFLPRHFVRTGSFRMDWIPKENMALMDPNADQLSFFVYAALQIGKTKPDIREQYLKLAVQLGSKRAAEYIQGGSGKFTPVYKGTRVEVDNNDVTQSIEIRILTEEETAYGEALDHINELLQQGFPKEYYLKLKSTQKNYLPLKKMAKSGLHQFFAGALAYPALYPKLAAYANIAMEPYAWYKDTNPGEKSVMPGTYAVLGLGLYSKEYFSLISRYMEMVDTEHQMIQDGYAEAFIDAHGVEAELIPVLVDILLAGNEEARSVKNFVIDRAELAEVLLREVSPKEIYEREQVLYRIFGSRAKLEKAVKSEQTEHELRVILSELLTLISC
ncbi:DUF6138 family protein [Paenibacillus odorifer]|uniref:Uncharacterized protein n=1 Tax=Paenibacillus odorifer TaxID=189426 RepID=A0A1R0X3F2_9BACL|nr:DUF6138 family protein [Paenibacillus odorifer]OMD27925.1 hypothetical protein BJP51_02100 [Paenibacillus odorifer]OME33206.1 hypothetical protein BSK63_11075 [Paenibacillus odorifer]OME40375.1 hypothetical protein BSK46_08410 [Paenibacillus odorifer]